MLPPSQVPLLSLAGLAFPFALAANIVFAVFWLLLYPRYLMVSLVACLVCAIQIRIFIPINFSRQSPPEGSLKVLSYNILSPNINVSNATRKNATITYLETADADIICLQEFHFAALKKQKNLLEEYPYKSYHLSGGNNESTARYLGCISKYPILSVESIAFSASSNGYAKYRILHGTDTIVVYNCHLQSNRLNTEDKNAYEQILSDPKGKIRNKDTKELVKKLRDSASKRATQTDIIIADLKKETSPYIIVCGDFNDSPISYTCHRLRETLHDAYTSSGNGPGISYNRNKLYYRIDHMLHSPHFKAYKCTVDRSIKTSDHYPIYCFLEKAQAKE